MQPLQRWVVGVGLWVLACMTFVVPWEVVGPGFVGNPNLGVFRAKEVRYGFLIRPPENAQEIAAVQWVVPLLIVILATRVLYAMAYQPPMTGPHRSPSLRSEDYHDSGRERRHS